MRYLILLVSVIPLALAANSLRFQVKEEQDPGALVGDVSQTDIPKRLRLSFGKIRYQIQGPADGIFEINAATGVLRTKILLNREKLPPSAQGDIFQIQIKVTTDTGGVSATIPTEVRVLDINDHSPKFPQDFEELQISESAPERSKFPLQRALDADIGNNSIQEYRIVRGNEDGLFSLSLKRFSPDMIYVYLVNTKRLDRETRDFYQLVIVAVDGGFPLPRSGRKEVNITILDSNDHSPEFSKDFYTASVPENAPNGTYLLRVTAIDQDIGKNGEIMFYLDESPERGLFRMDEYTGEIWTNAVLDYEVKSEYRLTVVAQDQGPDSIPVRAQVTIKVEDKNDNAPTIQVKLLQVPNAARPGLVPEDITTGSNVAIVEVRDRDSSLTVNSVVDVTLLHHKHDFALRRIFNTFYNLEVQRPLNLTRQSIYKIDFIARDRGVPTLETNNSLTLHIEDKNRHTPTYPTPSRDITIIDNTQPATIVSVFKAEDPDTDREGDLDYTITSLVMGEKNVTVDDPGRYFMYGQKSGELVVIPKLWCAFTPSFRLTLQAKDNGRERKHGEITLHVTVKCAKYQYNFSIVENSPVGTIVGRIGVNTRAPGKVVSFSVITTGRQDFMINNATGVIRTTRRLDREAVAAYDLVVLVTDGDVEMRLASIVNVVDVNDNAPVFIGLNDNDVMEVPSNAKRGDEVVTIRATDPDSGLNGKIQYSLIAGNDDKTFILDKDRGELVVFNYMFQSSYVLTIKASDSGNPPSESLVRIRIRVVPPEVLEGTTKMSTEVPVYDTRASEKGFLESTTMLIVVVLCSVFGLLIFCGVAFILYRCHRKRSQSVKTPQRKSTLPVAPRESYTEPEISREAAIKASKKMYSQATINMYPSNEMLDTVGRGKTSQGQGQAPPLPSKACLQMNSPASTIHRHHALPQYGEIYPQGTRPSSEGFSSGDELDSGKGDSSIASSPYTSHTLGRRYNDHNNHSHTAFNPHHTMNHTQNPTRHNKYPVVTIPTRGEKKKTIVSIANTPLAHAATDL